MNESENITIDKLSLTSAYLQMQFFYDNAVTNLGIGTGFFWEGSEQIFLITNWHNVSGRNFETNEPMDKKYASVPNQIFIKFFTTSSEGRIIPQEGTIKIRNDKDEPLWLEIKVVNSDIPLADVVAIPLGYNDLTKSIVCANHIKSDMIVNISQEVFILGYPKGILAGGLPIWKRASIASEPMINAYQEKPTILVDTATREGMSGAPVFADTKGPYKSSSSGNLILTTGTVRSFVGIYSGRLGKNEFEAQLGIVWKKEIIDHLLQ